MYFIYFIDLLSTTNVNLQSSYTYKSDAVSELETNAISYIRELEGSKQASIALQNNKSIDEILSNNDFKEGLYLKRDGEIITVYQKQKIVSAGKIWNSYELKMTKIGLFGVTYYKSDVHTKLENKPEVKHQQSTNNNIHGNLMEELNKLFNNSSNFGLKTIHKQHYD